MAIINNIPEVIHYVPGLSNHSFPDERMTPQLYEGYYFKMEPGNYTPNDWNRWMNEGYKVVSWNDKKNEWELYKNTNPRAIREGHYYVFKEPSLNTSTTSGTSSTTTVTPFNFKGLDLGLSLATTLQTTPLYNFKWYLDNKDNLNKYLNLANYNNDIRNKNLKYRDFIKIKDFLNPAIYNPMNTDEDGDPDTISYVEYEDYIKNNKDDFYNKFNVDDDSWLSDLGKLYFTFFNKNNGLDRILSYNDHLRMLYGEDLTYGGGDDNGDIINYLKNSPAYADDDKYKLARAYSLALRDGNRKLANRLSLYMIGQGTLHYGYGDHFDSKHQESRWRRKLGNGLKVEEFLDWIYNYYKLHPDMNKETLYNIVRNATKHNFKLDERTWRNFGEGWATIRDAYANALRLYKEGGQIFNMLFV